MPYIPQIQIGGTTYKIKDPDGYRNENLLPDGSDLNEVLGNRVVFVNSGAAHIPTNYPADFGTRGGCIITNNMTSNGSYRHQIAIRQTDGYVMYRRLAGNDGWSEWSDISSMRAIKIPDNGVNMGVGSPAYASIADLPSLSFMRVFNAPDAPEWMGSSSTGLWVLTMEETIAPNSSTVGHVQLAFSPSKGNISFRYCSNDNPYSEWIDTATEDIKEIKMLCIGNSADIDTVGYLPYVLQNVAPEIKLTLVIAFYPSASIDMHISAFDSDETVYFKCVHTPGVTAWDHTYGHGANATLKEILRSERWDFITFHQATSNQPEWSSYENLGTLVEKVVNYIGAAYNHPVKLGWLTVQTRPEDVERFPSVAKNSKRVLQTTPIDFVIPMATAIQNARSTSLQSIGDSGNLQCEDGKHLQDGLPRMIGAYTAAISILNMAGMGYRSIVCDRTLPTDEWLEDKDIPYKRGPSAGATYPNLRIAQKCAVEAIKNPYKVMEYSDVIMDDADTMVGRLNEALEFSTGSSIIRMTDGMYIDLSGSTVPMENGVPVFTSSSFMGSYDVGVVPCSRDDVFTINGRGGSTTRLWGFVDKNGNILSVSASSASGGVDGVVIRAPENATWLIIHDREKKTSYKGTRTDLEAIKEAVRENLPTNILPLFGKFISGSRRGITYTWDTNKKTCTMDGQTSDEISYCFIWTYEDGLPGEVEPGKSYQLVYETSVDDPDVSVHICYLHADDTVDRDMYYTENTILDIPEDCVGITIRFYVPRNTVCNDFVANIEFCTIASTDVSGGVSNHESKLLSVGSSFMTGLVYKYDVVSQTVKFDHTSSYDSSPYGNVAIGLGVERKNTTHVLLGSTGLLHDAGKGCILDKIESTDISEYDYILTEINRPDLGVSSGNGYALGNLSSQAGRTTIVGAVKELLAYMRQNNPNATLILVGPPPSDYREGWYGNNVFTVKYFGGQSVQSNGYSIGEADLMMHRLAVQEHFMYIDWEDWNVSYYYRTQCDGTNVHANNDATNRMMGQYLARCLSYSASQIKVLTANS